MAVQVTHFQGRTGLVDLTLPFRCQHCGAQTSALVRTDAASNAALALHGAACPGCGELQPAMRSSIESVLRRSASQKRMRIPLTIGMALLCGALFGWLGLRDLAETSAGLVAALGIVICAGAGTFAMFSSPLPVPKLASDNVWYWWSAPASPPAWVPAPPLRSAIDLPKAGTRFIQVVAGAVAGLGAMVAIGGMSAWIGTIESVYVLTAGAADPRGLRVRVDGVDTHLNPLATGSDVEYRTFTARTGHVHQVEVRDGDVRRTFDLDFRKEGHGTLLIPFASADRTPCLVEEKHVYGSGGSEPELNVLTPKDGVLTLPRIYDRDFQPLPPVAVTHNGAPTSKWALRAADCDALATTGDIVKFDGRTGANK